MNNRRLKFERALRAGLAGIFLFAGSVRAQENQSPFSSAESPVGEAGKSFFDRVFGADTTASEIDYFAMDFSNHALGSSALRSGLVPGWGQVFNGQTVKGYVLFFTVTAAAGGSYLLHEKSKDTYRDYENSGLQNGTLYDDYESEQTQSLILGVAAAGLWILSVVDAYRNAYSPLWKAKADGLSLEANAETTAVVWRRQF